MIAFEVFVNGKKLCVAGVGDEGVLTSVLTFVRRSHSQPAAEESPGRIDLHVGGLVSYPDHSSQHVDWLNQDVAVGDEITIRVVETEMIDEPARGELLPFECRFCGKKQSEVNKIIAGPQVYICGECVTAFLSLTENGSEQPMADELGKNGRCSFCGTSKEEVATLLSKNAGSICKGCLYICKEILADDAQRDNESSAT